MPIPGFPVILENVLCNLTETCSLSTYKVIGNSNGSSTVVIKFAAIPPSPCELPSYPPRPKSPSQLRRDRERRANYVNNNKSSTQPSSLRYEVSPPVSAQLYSNLPCSPGCPLSDSGIATDKSTNTQDSEFKHTADTSPLPQAKTKCDSPCLNEIIKTIHTDHKTKEPTPVYNNSTSNVCNVTGSVCCFTKTCVCEPEKLGPPCQDDTLCASETKSTDDFVFEPDTDYDVAVQNAEKTPWLARNQVNNPNKNLSHLPGKDEECGETAIIGETRDVNFAYLLSELRDFREAMRRSCSAFKEDLSMRNS